MFVDETHQKPQKPQPKEKKKLFNLILWFSRALREPNDIEAEQNDDWREAKWKKKKHIDLQRMA